MGIGREEPQDRVERLGQWPQRCQALTIRVQCLPPRQLAIHEEIGHFLKARAFGQIHCRIAAVTEPHGLLPNGRDRGLGRDDPFQTCCEHDGDASMTPKKPLIHPGAGHSAAGAFNPSAGAAYSISRVVLGRIAARATPQEKRGGKVFGCGIVSDDTHGIARSGAPYRPAREPGTDRAAAEVRHRLDLKRGDRLILSVEADGTFSCRVRGCSHRGFKGCSPM